MVPQVVYEQTLKKFLLPIEPLMTDDTVSEIMINGHSRIFVERHGRMELVSQRFSSELALMSALRVVAQYVGRPFDREHPILEGRLPDGSRVEAVLPELAKGGAHVAIRRFVSDKLQLKDLIRSASLTEEAAKVLEAMVLAKYNIVVSGGTGSGKTSLLNVLTGFVPDHERVVVLEDARELQPRGAHTVQLEARPCDERGRGAVSIRSLFKASLRLRPDRIILGEIRDGAALDLVQAMTSGHGGCMATLHASHPRDALSRLETMALMADIELPLVALRSQVASAVDVVLQLDRLRSGERVVTHVAEVDGLEVDGRYALRELFVRRNELVSTGVGPRKPERLWPCMDDLSRTPGRSLDLGAEGT